jgi:glycolate oxidase
MGGNVAENAGGPRAVQVRRDARLDPGDDRDADGRETLKLGRKTPKGVTGYDLVAMFVGSEGTFGVTSEITVRLIGKPEAAAALIAVMPDPMTAGKAVSAIIRNGFRPRALELMDRSSLDHVRAKAPYSFPADAGGIVLIELDGEAEGLEASILRAWRSCADARRRARGHRGRATRLTDSACGRSPPALFLEQPMRAAHRLEASRSPRLRRSPLGPSNRRDAPPRRRAVVPRYGLPSATYRACPPGDRNLLVNLLSDEKPPTSPRVARPIDGALGKQLFRGAYPGLGGALSANTGIGIIQGQSTWPGKQSRRGHRLAEAPCSASGIRAPCSIPARSLRTDGAAVAFLPLTSPISPSSFLQPLDLRLALRAGWSGAWSVLSVLLPIPWRISV